MNLWRLAFVALAAAMLGLTMGAGAVYAARPAVPLPVEVAAPIALVVAPKTPARWARYRAAAMRFVKVFAFVMLGFIAASVTSPEGLRAVVDPLNGLVILVASMAGAILKYMGWKSADGEAPALVTLALTPAPVPEAAT